MESHSVVGWYKPTFFGAGQQPINQACIVSHWLLLPDEVVPNVESLNFEQLTRFNAVLSPSQGRQFYLAFAGNSHLHFTRAKPSRKSHSILERKLRRVQQGPHQVFGGAAAGHALLGKQPLTDGPFLGIGQTRINEQVDFFYHARRATVLSR